LKIETGKCSVIISKLKTHNVQCEKSPADCERGEAEEEQQPPSRKGRRLHRPSDAPPPPPSVIIVSKNSLLPALFCVKK